MSKSNERRGSDRLDIRARHMSGLCSYRHGAVSPFVLVFEGCQHAEPHL
jgi:hypothetical protein